MCVRGRRRGGGGSESGLEVYIVFTPKMRGGGLACVPYHQGICLPQPGTNVIPD